MSESPDRQTPGPGEIFLDHVGWYVPDMDVASAAFERLGFPLSPYTPHSHESADGTRAPSGTANRCAMLERGYLEILTHVPELDLPLARQLRAGLDRYTGLHLIAFTCADADAEHARLNAEGFAPLPVAHLRRPIETDGGGEGMTRFSVIRLPPGTMAEGRIQALTQDTPEIVWQPSLIARDNAISALSGVVVCTDDPGETAGRFARFTGREARAKAGRIDIVLDRGVLSLVTPAQLSALIPGAESPAMPFIAAVVLRSRDLEATQRFLEARETPFGRMEAQNIVVPANVAVGASLVVLGPEANWPDG